MPRIELNISELTAEKQTLSDFLAQPHAYSDPDFTKKNKRFTELENIIAKATERETTEKQLLEAKELAGGSDELAELAKLEIPEDEAKPAAIEEELFVMLATKDPNDEKNIEIRAGAGGDESSLFGAELTGCTCAGAKPMAIKLN